MKVGAIKKLLKVDIDVLKKAEEDIAEDRSPDIEVEGDDEGEKLTHVYGAIWIQEQIRSGKMDEKEAIRCFMGKVRSSIS